MNIFIIILLVLGSIIAIFLIAGLLLPKNFKVSSEITINKPKEEVFDYLKLIRNQEKYSVWVMKDPNVKIVYTGTDGTVGFTSSWVSDDKNVGIGEQEIKSINEGESMEVEVRFKKPFEATNYALTTVTATGNEQTRVTTSFFGQCKFPMNVMFVFMSVVLKKDMLKNLQNMKANIEK
jgi:uncharacterized protein YndB with AHSA1/START domain